MLLRKCVSPNKNTYSVTELEDGRTLFGNYCEEPEGEGATEETRAMMQGAWDQLFLNLKVMVERDYQALLA